MNAAKWEALVICILCLTIGSCCAYDKYTESSVIKEAMKQGYIQNNYGKWVKSQ